MTHGRPVSAQSICRLHPRIGTTRRSAPIPNARLYSWASSPIVIPCTYGIGYMPMNERNLGSITGPSTSNPPIGFGRSSTITGLPALRAASIVNAIVVAYVKGRTPTSCRSITRTSTRDSICRVGCVTRPNRL